jgi:hypothetical protein
MGQGHDGGIREGSTVNTSPDVDAWFERYDNPQKALVDVVRRAILDADDRVTETIKWQAPTFVYCGNIASFFPKSKAHVSLMFHTGATLPDPEGLLEGEGAVARMAKFIDAEDLERKKPALQELIRAWIETRGA